jgi:hypothetical protein
VPNPTPSIPAGRSRKLLACALLLVATTTARADAAAGLDAFKGLQGRWAIHSDGKTLAIEMVYDVGSKGSIVTEQFGKELSVFYRDGESLEMTHFCNAGNQPRLRLKQGSAGGRFEFETFDVTNLAGPSVPHVQRIVYKMVDERHVELEIVWKNGKGESSENYTLVRI